MHRQEALSLLELSDDATPEDIKKAYKKKAKQYHPDLNKGDKISEEKFKQINEANDVLTKPQPANSFNPGGGFGDFESIFSTIFNAQRGNRPVNIMTDIGVSIDMLLNGGELNLSLSTGLYSNKPFNIKIEPDTPAFSKITSDNITIRLVPQSNKKYRVNNLDLIQETSIDVYQAMLGTSIEMITPRKTTVSMKIKTGTQIGDLYRIRGHGLKGPNGELGNLILIMKISIPILTGTKEEMIQKINDSLIKCL